LLGALTDSGEPWVFTLGLALSGLVWVPFGALVLGYPTGRLETRLERAIPITAGVLLTATTLVELLFDRTPSPDRCETCPESAIVVTELPGLVSMARIVAAIGSVVLIALVMGLFLRRWRGASPALRRVLAPVLGAASATLVSAGIFVVADQVFAQAAEDLLLVFYVVFSTVPLAFLLGILRIRLARSSVAEVVMALEGGTPLRDALSRALGDPSVEVAFRLDPERGLGGAGWVDPLGRAVPEPRPSRSRTVRYIDRGDKRIAALTCDVSLMHEPELVEAVTAAAGLAISNERLQAELRAEVQLAGALADTAPALLSNVDTSGRIVKLNPATLRASGYSDEGDVHGRHFWDVFIDDAEREEMKARFEAAAPDFPPAEYENAFTNARGERLVIYWRAAPVVDEGGRVVSIVAGGLDITERKRREEEARVGAERLRAVIESAPVAIVEIDLEDRVIQWNPTAERIFGWSAAEVLGKKTPLVPAGREHEFREILRENRSNRLLTGFETARLRRDGTLVDVELSSAPIRDASGAVVGHMAVFSDITERRMRAQEAERQRDFLQAITKAVPSFLVAVDPNAIVVEQNVNRAFLEAFGWAEEDIVGRGFLDLIAREDDHVARMAIANAANGVPQPERESLWFSRYGEERVVAWTARPVLDPEGRSLVLVSGTDVTVRRRQEEELRASRTRIVQAEDEARRRLERNLHDGAQQRLVALSVSLRLTESKLSDDPDKAAPILAGAREELAQALDELRELARGIHPAVLTDRGLGPALEALVARAPLPVELELPPERVAPAVEAAVYYVVAESLTNVAKYAEASSAAVRVVEGSGAVVVTVSDDGVGGADPSAGTGLRGLADRVAALDGTLSVESPRGSGTCVRAVIPLPREDAEADGLPQHGVGSLVDS
ncbi:MAG TPA: PAS domain S-box protein, partial [Gaiellaceae bacterium]|nr:PAS domain S-box protein [Gaiellaceae bacterium]